MALNPINVLQGTVRSFKSTLENEVNGKEQHVTIQLAEHYNSLLKKAADFQEIAEHLPPPISTHSTFEALGVTESSITDLKVYLNQLMTLMDLLDPAH